MPGTPTMEVCNGIDDDCDGVIDNGLGSTTCGVGACRRMVQNCVGGVMQMCMPGTPTPEVCNGIDDDCDGVIDNGLGTFTCGVGACQRTVPACVMGVTQTCVPGAPMPEICDGIDNDCNGVVDNGDPGGGGACNTMLPGVCSIGTNHCMGGHIVCVQNRTPTAEVCNGLDDNCDGLVDNAAITQLCPNNPVTSHVMTVVCNGGMGCGISMCVAGWYDVDGMYANGCECQDDNNAQACGSAVNINVATAGMATVTGKVVPANVPASPDYGDWFNLTFPPAAGSAPGGGTPTVSISPADGTFLFEIRASCTAGAPPLGCGPGGPPSATGLLTWDFTDNAATPGPNAWTSRAVPWPSPVYIRVYRTTPGLSCAGYTLTITR
jgi:hypothetical protein